jgi:hypothetical protein
VTNIISLDEKLKHSKEKKASIIKKRKILAVQKIFQCTQCVFKCEKCGTQMSQVEHDGKGYGRRLKIPYRFCESCSEEYVDYIERLNGRGDPDYYWHNENWLEVWRRWIDYQGVLDRYMKSKEFIQLLQELKNIEPDE